MPSSLCIVSQDHRGALPAGTHGLSCAGQLRKEKARGPPLRFIEPTWPVLMLKHARPKGEACRAEAKFWVFFCGETKTNCKACQLNFGAAKVIVRKGVSKSTDTSCCHPFFVSEHSRDIKPYIHPIVGLYRA